MAALKYLSGRFPLERKIQPIRGRANNMLVRKIAPKKLYRVNRGFNSPSPPPKCSFHLIVPHTALEQPSPSLEKSRFYVRRRSGCAQAIANTKPYTSTITNLIFFFDIPGSHSCDYIFHVLTNLICWANVNIVNISGIHTMYQSDNHVIYMVISQTNVLYCHDVWF